MSSAFKYVCLRSNSVFHRGQPGSVYPRGTAAKSGTGNTSARARGGGGGQSSKLLSELLSSGGRRAPRSLHAHRAPLSPNPISPQANCLCVRRRLGLLRFGLQSIASPCSYSVPTAGEHSHKMLPLGRESTAQTPCLPNPWHFRHPALLDHGSRGKMLHWAVCASMKHLPRCFLSTSVSHITAVRSGHLSALHEMPSRQRWPRWQPPEEEEGSCSALGCGRTCKAQ